MKENKFSKLSLQACRDLEAVRGREFELLVKARDEAQRKLDEWLQEGREITNRIIELLEAKT
jgi:hypothetical protein